MASVVFCEDDPMIRKLVAAALRDSPHAIHIAPDGATGLELIRREHPVVVFTDVTMPIMDGYQLADRMKADPDLAKVPIVFMSPSVQRAQIEEALAHGAAGVLAKPFSVAELRGKVEEFTGGARP